MRAEDVQAPTGLARWEHAAESSSWRYDWNGVAERVGALYDALLSD